MSNNVNYRDLIKQEYSRCLESPMYFIKNYCFIQHAMRGKIKFNLYEFQENVLAAFIHNPRNIILKNRQMGLSTLAAAYSFWLMTFFPDKNILVIATKQGVAKNIITKVRTMHELLPSWLKRKCTEDNKLGLAYDNGSKIFASTSTSDSGRSEALSLLIVDEAAFIYGMDDLWTSLQPTLSTGGDIIILSTPNGVGNWYHQTFITAEEGKNNFYPITLHWKLHPERDQVWRDAQDIELGYKKAKQECDASFLASGETVIPGELLEFYRLTHCKDPIQKTGFDNNVWIWEFPDYTKKYMIIADVARGDGKDNSTFHVIELENMIQVAEYQGKIGTREFSNLLVEYATKYNDALLVVENVGIGWSVIQGVIDREYKNLFYTDSSTAYIDAKVEEKYIRKNNNNTKSIPGFTTSLKTRPLIISKMEQYFTERTITIKSIRLINELTTFVWRNGRPEASPNYNDDLVIALAIGLWVRDTALRLFEKSKDMTKTALDLFKVEKGGIHIVNQYTYLQNPRYMKVGKDNFDLRELI